MDMRARIRRWLGVPTHSEVRAAILREIDADKAAEVAAEKGRASIIDMMTWRRERARAREARIVQGYREDTRGSI